MADTPYAQVPPLPPWMAGPGTGGAEARLPSSSAAAAQGAGPPDSESILDRETRTREELLAAIERTSEGLAASARARVRAQVQRIYERAATPGAQQPIGADVLNQALGDSPLLHPSVNIASQSAPLHCTL